MRSVTWSEAAGRDYLDILDYVAADDPETAERVANAIATTGDKLGDFATGHPGRVRGTYEKLVRRPPCIIVYALADGDKAVSILRVIHSARDWPDGYWPD